MRGKKGRPAQLFAQSFTTCTTIDPVTFANFSICILSESQLSSVLSSFSSLEKSLG